MKAVEFFPLEYIHCSISCEYFTAMKNNKESNQPLDKRRCTRHLVDMSILVYFELLFRGSAMRQMSERNNHQCRVYEGSPPYRRPGDGKAFRPVER